MVGFLGREHTLLGHVHFMPFAGKGFAFVSQRGGRGQEGDGLSEVGGEWQPQLAGMAVSALQLRVAPVYTRPDFVSR